MKRYDNWRSCGYIAVDLDRGTLKVMIQDPLNSKKYYAICEVWQVLELCTGKRGTTALYMRKR